MLASLGLDSLEQLIEQTIPASIRAAAPLALEGVIAGRDPGEREVLEQLRAMMAKNELKRSLIGMGYYDTITPQVIQRNILENPGWYTQYTPYQAEISQGRLEALLIYQTMICDLTGLPMANASLLDEATAAAEAVHMCVGLTRNKRRRVLVARDCHPQTIAVVQTRAEAAGFEVIVGEVGELELSDATANKQLAAVLVQYPTTDGRVLDYAELCARAHAAGAKVIVAADLLALTVLRAPGSFGADVAIGSAQRFGVPLGYGGPHSAFLAADNAFKRKMPGRIIGVSKDAQGRPAYRMAMQTREQHIRREKATSNICTAQVLLAIMAGMYGVYHGPQGLRRIGERVHALTCALAEGLRRLGHDVGDAPFFDTLTARLSGCDAARVHAAARAAGFNLRERADAQTVGVSLDEKTTPEELEALLGVFAGLVDDAPRLVVDELLEAAARGVPAPHARDVDYLTHAHFNSYQAEHEMLRFLNRLQARDLSLTTSMIPLGSCTMKLNATSEMVPVTWPEVGGVHPFAPLEQARGYAGLVGSLASWLAEITGFAAVSLQPNAGAQGEYTGLLTIRAYHRANGQGHRDICLIPTSAHGTNPASAVLAGMKVIAVRCDELGNIDVEDLQAKAAKHKDKLAALMVTYPSTHGVFEARIRDICAAIHDNGGQVYLDGANMNAQVGLCRPGDYGADVCHLNLHKTFCIPHGGGGPGMGPIGVASHLAPFLPGHPVIKTGGEQAIGAIAAAPWGSASILVISWMYIAMMGARGLTRATQVAILNANYMASRLAEHYPILYRGANGRVAHEFIIDIRPIKQACGVAAVDVAKRLMDYGFHAPTMSFPVAGTLMIEPTESESREELDRLCDALIEIRREIRAVEYGQQPQDNNVLTNAPHTAEVVTGDDWDRPYTRREAAFPSGATWLKGQKFWPHVGRIDDAYGDRNFHCTCPSVEELAEAAE